LGKGFERAGGRGNGQAGRHGIPPAHMIPLPRAYVNKLPLGYPFFALSAPLRRFRAVAVPIPSQGRAQLTAMRAETQNTERLSIVRFFRRALPSFTAAIYSTAETYGRY